MNKPENCSLSKVKLMKGGGIEIHYREQTEVNGITDTKDWKITNTINPHPDLTNKLEELKQFLGKCYGMDAFITLSKSKGLDKAQKDAFKSVALVMNNVQATNMEKMAITGVSIRGEVENEKDGRSVVITGTMEQENKSKTALNSPSIKLANDQFKFEADVQDIINDLDEEVMAYLFDGKKYQLDAFDQPKEELEEVA